ncbi:putative membrane protein YiaA [Pedobacter sp. UYP30]|uniref:hypothetical protein n=1 Tax=Pedobacter sp. UYP30 TaxID=1756400 RepID=UPI0033920FA8
MTVEKTVLQKKTDRELEQYILPDSAYVPQAIEYAFEILKSRGRVFSVDELERLYALIEKGNLKEKIVVHQNYILASNLMFASVALWLIGLFVRSETLNSSRTVFISVLTLSFSVGIGFAIRAGVESIKYFLLVSLIFGLIVLPTVVQNLLNAPIELIIYVIQTIIQIAALVLLFKIPKARLQELV